MGGAESVQKRIEQGDSLLEEQLKKDYIWSKAGEKLEGSLDQYIIGGLHLPRKIRKNML
jgi:hypothetical protein